MAGALSAAQRRPPKYSIARQDTTGLQEKVVQQGETVRPGDVIKVEVPSPYETTASTTVDQYSAAPMIGAGVLGGRLD